MKYILIIAFLVSATICSIQAQTIQYTYDNAGNRTQRKVLVNLVPPDTETAAIARNSSVTELEDEQDTILKSIQVFPNPTQDQLQISIGVELPNATIELFDLSGKLLQQQKLRGGQQSLDIAKQVSGEYLLVIRNEFFSEHWKVVKIE